MAMLASPHDTLQRLRTPDRHGVYASLGRWFNNALFARDNLLISRMLLDEDKELAKQTIATCVYFQGISTNKRSAEEPGKIYHEYRWLSEWHGDYRDRLRVQLWSLLWNGSTKHLLSYFDYDNTGQFILLVNAYAKRHPEILTEVLTRRDGLNVSVAEAVREAAKWLISKQDTSSGVFWFQRTSRWQFAHQTWKDSLNSYTSATGDVVDPTKPVCYLITQTLGADALLKSAKLLSELDPKFATVCQVAGNLGTKGIDEFWLEEAAYFASIKYRGDKGVVTFTTPTSDPVWLLASSLMQSPALIHAAKYQNAIMRRLQQPDFLTPAGIRARSLEYQPSLPVLDYHGAYSVWPLDNYLFAVGAANCGNQELACNIVNRYRETIKQTGHYWEYFLVDCSGTILINSLQSDSATRVQFAPEQNQAWTVAAYVAGPKHLTGTATRHRGAELPIAKTTYNDHLGLERILLHYSGPALKSLFWRY